MGETTTVCKRDRRQEIHMANHFRIYGVVFSKDPTPVEKFSDGLKSGGWGDQVPIPEPHEGECGYDDGRRLKADSELCVTCQRTALGPIVFPDIRLLTCDGVTLLVSRAE
jgi:hypothetical protein